MTLRGTVYADKDANVMEYDKAYHLYFNLYIYETVADESESQSKTLQWFFAPI